MMSLCRVQASRPRLLQWRTLAAATSRTVSKEPSDHLSGALSFEDPSAFRVKSFGELLRAMGVFCFCSFPVLVNNCGKVRLGAAIWLNVCESDTKVCVWIRRL